MNTIYTAIFGKYDSLKEPLVVTPGWRYICFTDQDFKSDTWEIVKTFPNNDQIRTARLYKITAFKLFPSDYSIYIDGSFQINCNLNEWVKKHPGDFVTMRHLWRNCAYQEAETCLKIAKGEADLIKKQVKKYRLLGLPEGNGLISSGILMRKKTEKVVNFCEKWWSEVYQNSTRDQLSFAFTDFLYPGTHVSYDYDYFDRQEFKFIKHDLRECAEKVKR